MKELQNILKAFQQAQAHQQRAAIATVVKTQGSVYRRPGARMLMTETKQMVGAISGGCLESDVFEQAQPLMASGGQPIRACYDATATQDLIWGLGMGCNGAVEVLIESLHTESANRQLDFIAECFQQHQAGAIATVFHIEGESDVSIADRLFLKSDGTIVDAIAHSQLRTRLLSDTYQTLATGKNQVVTYPVDQGCVEVFIEAIHPPVSLLVVGAGYDAIPVVQLSKQLGWQVTVMDHRSTYAMRDRFPQADQVIIGHPDALSSVLNGAALTAAVVMTHHYLQDKNWLKTLLPLPSRYVGVLGSKQRTQQLINDLQVEGFSSESCLHHLYAPIGLDIGAETPEEIALAIVAEIQAVLAGRTGGHLRSRLGSIHSESDSWLTLV